MGVPQGSRLNLPSTSMQKTKSPSSSKSRHIIHTWWKGKSAPSSPSAGKTFWSPEADKNIWYNMKNRVVLSPTSLLHLTEMERAALQKIALARLQATNLGVPITIPKDGMNSKSKKSRFLLKRRAVSSNVIDSLIPTDTPQDRNPSGKASTQSKTSGWVFGIPLAKCIANDMELRRSASSNCDTTHSNACDKSHAPLRNRKSSSSSGGALSNDESESDCGRAAGSNLLDALLLPVSSRLDSSRIRTQVIPPSPSPSPTPRQQQQQQQHLMEHQPAMPSETTLRVPYIVNVCCQYLQTYGVGVLGIFRIGSSKKRTIQLRDEFDTGREVLLTEEHNPHDVGAVLKEFFRDMPDPLLTRSLYSAFVATRKLNDDRLRIRSVNLLLALLPPCNRDTLWALLSFLNRIAKHSTDFVDDQGNKVPGNKMDAHNLATLFGPNILHKAKGGAFQVESLERAEERAEVISVVKEMIEHQTDIFELPAELHDETLRDLAKTRPEDVDYILRCRTINFSVDADPESSSSVCEESDSSSMPPHSPGYSSETDASLHPPSFIDSFQIPSKNSPSHRGESRTLIEFLQSHASSSTPSLPSIAIGIACPPPPRLPDLDRSRSPQLGGGSSLTDRSPGCRKKPHPDMRIEITPDCDEGPDPVPAPDDPRSGSRRVSGAPHGCGSGGDGAPSRRSSTAVGGKRQTLTVPSNVYSGRDSDLSSTPSPRHSPCSSRSPSCSSSPSPEPTWIQCPGSPSSFTLTSGQLVANSSMPSNLSPMSCSPSPGWSSSSSKHRPLGLSSFSHQCGPVSSSTFGSHQRPSLNEISPGWHEARWREWSRISQQKAEELQEQETPV